MTKKVKLDTTPDQFHGLHTQAQSKGKAVRVDRAALASILIDHSRLINYIGTDNLEGHT